MPREQISYNPIVTKQMSDADGTLTAEVHREVLRRNVHVSWDAIGGWVQVAVDVTVAELRDMLKLAIEQAEAEDRRMGPGMDIDIENYQSHVFSDVLDRAEVNRAIRMLRTARDKAYGKDE